jgi:hypothetical protein
MRQSSALRERRASDIFERDEAGWRLRDHGELDDHAHNDDDDDDNDNANAIDIDETADDAGDDVSGASVAHGDATRARTRRSGSDATHDGMRCFDAFDAR